MQHEEWIESRQTMERDPLGNQCSIQVRSEAQTMMVALEMERHGWDDLLKAESRDPVLINRLDVGNEEKGGSRNDSLVSCLNNWL